MNRSLRSSPAPTRTRARALGATAARALAVIMPWLCLFPATPAHALGPLEQIAVETYAAMREVERHQLKVAEKHYEKGEFKVALDEYDKFLTLYESSPGAPYAQLMWSHCQVKLRMVNTAIRDGFQSVVDYWPDSREAVLASYLIGRSYDDIGQVEQAEAAYKKTINDHPGEHIATLAKLDLLHLAKVRKDERTQMVLLADLTYNTERTEENRGQVTNAARELAGRHLAAGDNAEAIRALETLYADDALVRAYGDIARGAIDRFLRDDATKERGIELADSVIAMTAGLIPDVVEGDGPRAAAREAWSRIAGLYGQTGRDSKVLETYQTMIKVLGVDDGLLGNLAEFYKGRGRRDEARATYARFADAVAGQLAVAAMWREEGKHDEAIAIYETLIAQDEENTDRYRWAIGECYEASDRLRAAVNAYRQVDDFPRTYFQMASCLRRLGDHREALALYTQCKVHEPSAPDAFLNIAYTYEEAGQRENAVRAFQLTCKNFPKSGQASRAHAHLQDKYGINVTLGGAKEE